MRVAFTGTHRTGKTTLLDAMSSRLPTYVVLEEPYRMLEDDGYEFSDPPSVEDFERQLRCSIETIAAARADVLIDRCPLDFVAYLQAIDERFEAEDWLDEIRDAMARLDLIVVLSIETPDRIAVQSHDDLVLRRRVDESLRTLLLDDPYGFERPTVEVFGRLDDRVQQVTRAMTSV